MRNATTYYVNFVSALLLFLFVYTTLSKLSDFNFFRATLSTQPLIGDNSHWVSWAIIIPEIVISILLFIPKYRMVGLICSVSILIVFTIYIAYMLATFPHLPCSCGGVISKMSWTQHLFFNTTLILLGIAAVYLKKSNKLFIAINRSSRIPV